MKLDARGLGGLLDQLGDKREAVRLAPIAKHGGNCVRGNRGVLVRQLTKSLPDGAVPQVIEGVTLNALPSLCQIFGVHEHRPE
ncbi:MAG TPA: hypothetical protein PKM43_21310 [Verrucomicrobiota bacterium]|nr:hypothetical protein [Verrucomicrobiota bacterium]